MCLSEQGDVGTGYIYPILIKLRSQPFPNDMNTNVCRVVYSLSWLLHKHTLIGETENYKSSTCVIVNSLQILACTVGASSSVTRRVLSEVSIESQILISTHNGLIWGSLCTSFSQLPV